MYKISKQKKIELEKRLQFLETIEKDRINDLMADNRWTESTRKYVVAVQEKNAYLSELEDIKGSLKNCVIINQSKIDKTKVDVGVTVRLASGDKELEFKIVSLVEVNPTKKKISLESPLGERLAGKKVGDVLTFSNKSFRIVGIQQTLG